MRIFSLVFAIMAFSHFSFAVVSFQTSTSLGYYKDVRQRSRVPFYTSWAYQGLHDRGVETSFQIFLNNDFSQNSWQVQPAYGSVVVPLSTKRPSRVEVGRSLWTEGFDLTLLDGAQLPLYFTQTAGVFIYGGATHSLDLFEDQPGLVVGSSLFEEFWQTKLRAGWMGRDNNAKKQSVFGSAYRQFEFLPLQPSLLLKQELDLNQGRPSQFLGEVALYPGDTFGLTAAYSYREPRLYSESESQFLYRLFSSTPQQTQEYSVYWKVMSDLRANLATRFSLYNNGVVDNRGDQQDFALDWRYRKHNFIPGVAHIQSSLGEVWSFGIKHNLEISDTYSWFSEVFTAHIDRLRRRGWAYHLRTGAEFNVASYTSLMSWFELERNHIFEFDGRVMGYVTQYY